MTKSDSGPMPRDAGRRNTSRRWKDFMQMVRRAYLYFGLFMLPWILLYSTTGFLFNHPTFFSTIQMKAEIDLAKLEVGRMGSEHRRRGGMGGGKGGH